MPECIERTRIEERRLLLATYATRTWCAEMLSVRSVQRMGGRWGYDREGTELTREEETQRFALVRYS